MDKALLGDDFIACCTFCHQPKKDIIITTIDMEEFHLSKEQAEAEISAYSSERSPTKKLAHLSGLNRTEVVRLCSALRSKGIKCRIMPVPIGEQGDTQLR